MIPYFIWGTMSIPLRVIKSYPAEDILFYRVIISIIFALFITFIFRRDKVKSDWEYIIQLNRAGFLKLTLLIIVSACLITSNWYTYIYAVNNISLKSAAFAYLVCPIITALCSWLILKEQLSKQKILAISLAFGSIILLATGSFIEAVWSIGIATLYALYVIVLKVIKGIDKFNLLIIQLVISCMILSPIFMYNEHLVSTDNIFWLDIIIISLFFTLIPLFLVSYALQGLSAATSGIFIYINPIIAFTVAIFYFNERIDMHQIFAYLILLLSILIFNLKMGKKGLEN